MNTLFIVLIVSSFILIGMPGTASSSSLVITGVIDGPLGGGTPKAVELYAFVDIDDLGIYGIGSATNGGGTDGEEFSFTGMASAGSFLYVSYEATGFNNYFGFAPDFTTGGVNINGDDAIELFMNGGVVDLFGDIDVDGTGSSWEYTDGWAYRRNSFGSNTAFTLSEWTISGANALDGSISNTAANNPFPLGSYSRLLTTPIPTSLLLLSAGLIGLIGVRRREKT